MHAVICDGGKQYRVQEGDTLLVEKKDLLPGETVQFDQVLSLSDGEKSQVGTPYLKDISVTGRVKGITPGPKVIVFKFRRRKSSHTKNGHRQKYTEVQITKINTKEEKK